MARTVFLHVGLPKTGTTYLQTIAWANEAVLRDQGVLLPGFGPRQHLWASAVVREETRVRRRHEEAPQAWDRLVGEVRAWPGTALISHEFFAGASAGQAREAVAALRVEETGTQVHVVVTARDTLSLVTARWQEMVKNGSTVAVDDYPASEETSPADPWDWGSMDLADVLARWGAAVPAERVHVLTLPKPSEPREALWARFADLLGLPPDCCDLGGSTANESLGVVEVELLRRVNAELTGFRSAFDRGVWIRGYLAQETLVPRAGEKFWPSVERIEELRARGEAAVAFVAEQGFDVIGDLEDLRTPQDLPARRHPSSVTDAEMLAAATTTIGSMLTDVRRLTGQHRGRGGAGRRDRTAANDAPSARDGRVGPAARVGVRKAARTARGLWRRSQHRLPRRGDTGQ